MPRGKLKSLLITAGKAARLNKLFWYIHGYIRDDRDLNSPLTKVGTFVDSNGFSHNRYAELRDRLKPGWRNMFAASSNTLTVPPLDKRQAKLKMNKVRLRQMEIYLQDHGISLSGRDAVEIGSFDGATAYALAKAGCASVLGTDMAVYYLHQSSGDDATQAQIDAKNVELKAVRDSYAELVGDAAARVRFEEDDICASELPAASADLIVGWEVLEHILEPQAAFDHMARVLKPGGIAFHDYNPFFSIIGGHSLCTLDFLWGHARLSDEDFSRYLDEIRPQEKDVALSFYHRALNRMSHAALREHARSAGLEIVDIKPWASREHMAVMEAETLPQVQQLYPSVTLNDLVSPFVWILVRKPE